VLEGHHASPESTTNPPAFKRARIVEFSDPEPLVLVSRVPSERKVVRLTRGVGQVHDDRLCRMLAQMHISEGVQWELARLVSTGKFNLHAVTHAHITQLSGENKNAAPRVQAVLRQTTASDELIHDAYKSEYEMKVC
jgi:hypothetical protein